MYAELQIATNFSFLTGASHPHEIAQQAHELGYTYIGITDRNTLSGVVRFSTAATQYGIHPLIGCRLELETTYSHSVGKQSEYLRTSLLVYPKDRVGYGKLCRLLTEGRASVSKNEFFFSLDQFLPYQKHFITIIVPPFFQSRLHLEHQWNNLASPHFYDLCKTLRDNSDCLLAITQCYGPQNQRYIKEALQICRSLNISPIVTNDVLYHTPTRKPLQDVLRCISEGVTIQQAGLRIHANGERYLKPPAEIARLFREIPHAVSKTLYVAEMCKGFSLQQVRYHYPEEVCPPDISPQKYLQEQVYLGAHKLFPQGIPDKVTRLLQEEFTLIRELEYEKYFLTCYDIVNFARSQGILCQGRGAAANSVVCYCLGITAVDPTKIDLLFARFVSKERKEPPDIDIDFEHERREEVIQYIYKKYGRERAAIASEVVTYRPRSAIREVGKALGLPLQTVDSLAKSVHRWTGCTITAEILREVGVDPFNVTIQNALSLANEILGFPRHLSQHVGGFIISQSPLCEIAPIINAGMEGRTIIEWDKNDIEELGMLKIDVLALGMLTCIRKAIQLVNQGNPDRELTFGTIPSEAPEVYEMLARSDTIGVFQVESRAQMSMLPRLKPKCFYDLVIEVAIVRPGPIQGNMVHPYLRRRNGYERPYYPDTRVEQILGKTLGVPIFQEQAMRLAIVLAQFTPDEAEALRKAMAAWKSDKGAIATFKEKIIKGMCDNGYSLQFAETCLHQIKGFSEYGFPESHAASFALLVYASAWLKRFYPAEFYCALLNSQPMGFYSPSQIIRDAQKHRIQVHEIDVHHSKWDCTLEREHHGSPPAIRLGLRLVVGLRESEGQKLTALLEQRESKSSSITELYSEPHTISKSSIKRLAHADTFTSLGLTRRSALWETLALPHTTTPMDTLFNATPHRSAPPLPHTTLQQEMFEDLLRTGVSLKAHPIQFIRPALKNRGAYTAEELTIAHGLKVGAFVSVCGIVTIKQRPGTAKGVVFITLEDETGAVNLIIRPQVFTQHQSCILSSSTLLASGKLERIGEVVYLDTATLISTDELVSPRKQLKYSLKSYSY